MSLSPFLLMEFSREVEQLGVAGEAQSREDTRGQQEKRRRLGMDWAHWEVKQY